MDFGTLKLPPVEPDREQDPLAIFAHAVQRGEIETLRGAQQEALKEWHQHHRSKGDVLLSMDTGGGKSLVGLLAAQSLCNELARPVVYLCASIHLVEQVARQAGDAGIAVDCYLSSQHSDAAGFYSGQVPGLMTYHAIFNGLSRFTDLSLAGAIFDDAHVAESLIRDCYTVSLPKDHPFFGQVADVLYEHFKETPFETEYLQRVSGAASKGAPPLLIPRYFVAGQVASFTKFLRAARDDGELKFAAAHLVEHAAQLVCLVGNGRIELTPWGLPISASPVFGPDVRRIYLSATLPSQRSFARTFGRLPEVTIEPEGKTNAAQRIFVFPPGDDIEERRKYALTMLAEERCAIIVPSNHHAADWENIGVRLPRGSGYEVLERFSREPCGRLVLVSRYDGLDLPGDLCRALIVEGLPVGEHLLEGFYSSSLQLKDERRRRIADRLIQGLGRIFRGNRDHGVIVVTDPSVEAWLRHGDNQAMLPSLLRQQLKLSLRLADGLGDEVPAAEWTDSFRKITKGDEKWDEFYQRNLAAVEDDPIETADALVEVVVAEFEAASAMWRHEYERAAKAIEDAVGRSDAELSSGHKGWLLHCAGLAALLDADSEAAAKWFDEARRLLARLGRPLSLQPKPLLGQLQPSRQASACAERLSDNWQAEINKIIEQLRGEGGQNATEHQSALVRLGVLLGLHSRNADEGEGGRGPDAFWRSPDQQDDALAIEAKTQKSADGMYSKQDMAQAVNSLEWARSGQGATHAGIIVVGPELPVARQATPPTELRVVSVSEMIDVAGRLRQCFQRVNVRGPGIGAAPAMEEALRQEGLRFDQLRQGLKGVLAVDLIE